MSSFSEQRQAIQAESEKAIAAAQNSDRQARLRARTQVRKNQPDFDQLPEDEQERLLNDADEICMQRRRDKEQDFDTKTAKILDKEMAKLEAIKKEESARRLKLLGVDSNSKKRKRENDDDDDDDKDEIEKVEEGELISKAFNKHMTPVIEKWERQIIAGGDRVVPGVSEEELETFTKDASNPTNVREYLEKWDREDADIDEGLDGEGEGEEFDDDDIEIVVTDDEIRAASLNFNILRPYASFGENIKICPDLAKARLNYILIIGS